MGPSETLPSLWYPSWSNSTISSDFSVLFLHNLPLLWFSNLWPLYLFVVHFTDDRTSVTWEPRKNHWCNLPSKSAKFLGKVLFLLSAFSMMSKFRWLETKECVWIEEQWRMENFCLYQVNLYSWFLCARNFTLFPPY